MGAASYMVRMEKQKMDRAQAIRDAKEMRQTHVAWRTWLIKNGEPESITYYTGDIRGQEDCIAAYDNILEVLQHRYPMLDPVEEGDVCHYEDEVMIDLPALTAVHRQRGAAC